MNSKTAMRASAWDSNVRRSMLARFHDLIRTISTGQSLCAEALVITDRQ